MSSVTNVLLGFDVLEDEDARLAEVNAFFSPERHRRGLVSIEAPGDWYGGTKAFEHPLFVGAFNYLNEEEFMGHLRSLPWEYPEHVQVILCRQDDDVFSILTLDVGPLVNEDASTLVTEVEHLRDALLKYGRHLDDCVFYQDDDSDLEAYGPSGCCTCGFDDALHPD